MPQHLRLKQTFVALCFLATSSAACTAAAQHSKLLPAKTFAAVSLLDFVTFQEHWNASGLAAYLSVDGIAETYRQLHRQSNFDSFWLTAFDPEALVEFVDGQLTFAAIENASTIEFVLLAEIGDRSAAALRWQQAARERFEAKGAASSESVFENARLLTLTRRSEDGTSNLIFGHRKDLMVVGSNMEVVQSILAVDNSSLAQTSSFENTVTRAATETGDANFWWYVEPLTVMRMTEQPASSNRDRSISNYRLATAEGFEAIKAVGGCGKYGQSPVVSSTGFIVADKPFRRGMRMLDMTNTPAPDLPSWFAGSTSSGAINIELKKLLENYSTWFDTLYGEGESGIFDLVLDDLKSDPKGPGIDLQRELFDQLVTPVYFATQMSESLSPTIFGVRTSDQRMLTVAFTKIYQGDSNARKLHNVKYDAWQVAPLDEMDVGIREPYVVAIRDNFLLIAPTLEAIETAFKNRDNSNRRSFSNDYLKALGDQTCFHYRADSKSIAKFRHRQIARGQVKGLLGRLFDRLELSEALRKIDKSNWPAFSEAGAKLSSQLEVSGTATETGWKIYIKIDE